MIKVPMMMERVREASSGFCLTGMPLSQFRENLSRSPDDQSEKHDHQRNHPLSYTSGYTSSINGGRDDVSLPPHLSSHSSGTQKILGAETSFFFLQSYIPPLFYDTSHLLFLSLCLSLYITPDSLHL